MIDPDPMLVVADIAEKDIAQIQLGSEATAKLISGRFIKGLVTFIAVSYTHLTLPTILLV